MRRSEMDHCPMCHYALNKAEDKIDQLPIDQGEDKEKGADVKSIPTNERPPDFHDLLSMLNEMNKSFDGLPMHAQFGYVTQCDLNAALLLIYQIFKSPRD